jgi:hypothetical protein
MKWKSKYMESGWVAEILGFKTKYNFRVEYLEPVGGKKEACKDKLATYELDEGKMYIIQKTDDETNYYVKIEDGEIIYISRDEVSKTLKKYIHKSSAQSETNGYKKKFMNSDKSRDNLNKNLEFIIDNIEQAKKFREADEEDVFKGMIIFAWNFARDYEVSESHFKMICDSLIKDGKTALDVKNKLISSKKTFNFNDYMPIPIY